MILNVELADLVQLEQSDMFTDVDVLKDVVTEDYIAEKYNIVKSPPKTDKELMDLFDKYKTASFRAVLECFWMDRLEMMKILYENMAEKSYKAVIKEAIAHEKRTTV